MKAAASKRTNLDFISLVDFILTFSKQKHFTKVQQNRPVSFVWAKLAPGHRSTVAFATEHRKKRTSSKHTLQSYQYAVAHRTSYFIQLNWKYNRMMILPLISLGGLTRTHRSIHPKAFIPFFLFASLLSELLSLFLSTSRQRRNHKEAAAPPVQPASGAHA